jgi:hypothetical protein
MMSWTAIACAQDDDTPSGSTWVAEAAALLAAHPRLIYITGYRAR